MKVDDWRYMRYGHCLQMLSLEGFEQIQPRTPLEAELLSGFAVMPQAILNV